MSEQSVAVTLVERRPNPVQHFSIERVFDAVVAHAPATCDVTRFQVPAVGIRPWAMIRNVLSVRRLRAEVVHVTGDVHYVLPAVRRSSLRVLTIHDLDTLHRTRGVRRRLLRLLWFTWPLRVADAVTTVSEETRRQVVAEFPWVAPRVTVVGNPLGNPFDQKLEQPVRARPARPGPPLVLAIGTRANKNLTATTEAVRRTGAALRVVGVVDDGLRQALDGARIDWSATHSITDDELLAEYEKADVLSFPSLHEGFGLPILEAQAAGVPVVTSDLPPMNVVAGGAALLVDPLRPEELAAALTALADDDGLRVRLVTRGRENAARRAPARVAAEYAELYADLVAASRNRRPRTGEVETA